jgi:hypothetical protein
MNYLKFKNFVLITISYFAGIGCVTSLLVLDLVPTKYVWIPEITSLICFLWIMFFNYANFLRKKEKEDDQM